MSESQFHWADYLVTAIMLVVSLGIGFFFACFKGGQKTKVEYLLGNREMGLGPVCLSLFVTFQSAISLIGLPSDTYDTGSMVFYMYFGMSLAYIVGYFTVVPVVYPLHLTSVYEYLELRFKSTAVRLLGTGIGMFQTILYMGVALFSPALALQAAAGIPLWVSVAIVGTIGTVYTAAGGIKSVVWTDAFQTIVVFIGMITVLIKGLNTVGGFSNMIDIADRGGRVDFSEVNPDPRERHSMWSCIIGGCFMWVVNCFNQSAVQRIGSLRTLRAAKIAFLINIPLHIVYGGILTLTGLLLYAYVVTIGCDPHHAGLIHNKNQMMPYYVIHVLDDLPGFAGLYMSMLFSGALSTVSSGINALAANSVEDLLARPLRGFRDTTVTAIAKVLVVVFGMTTIGLAYAMKELQGPVTQLAITAFGACGGPIVGMFMLGGAIPRANKYGAMIGGLTGLVINLWLAVGAVLHGRPTASLPPGPIDNCDFGNSTVTGSGFLNSSVNGLLANTTVPSFQQVTYSGSSNGLPTLGSIMESTMMMNRTTELADEAFSIYDISYLWLGLSGVLSSFLSGLIVSFITGSTDPSTVDPRLIFPFCRKILGMPEPIHRPEDTSNVIAMKTYRNAWDTFRRTSLNQEILTDEAEKAIHYLSTLPNIEEKNSEDSTFLQPKRLEAD